MFGVSPFELLVVLLLGLVALGPERLPKVMRLVMRLFSELRRVSVDLQRAVNLEGRLPDTSRLRQQARELLDSAAVSPPQNAGDRETPEAPEQAARERIVPDEAVPDEAAPDQADEVRPAPDQDDAPSPAPEDGPQPSPAPNQEDQGGQEGQGKDAGIRPDKDDAA